MHTPGARRVAGALAGFVAGVALTSWFYPDAPIVWEDPAVHRAFMLLHFASLPFGAVLGGVWVADWERHIRLVMLVGPALNGAAAGASLVWVGQRLRTSHAVRHSLALALAVESVLIILLARIGIPSPMAPYNPAAEAITATHIPGIMLLERIGLCCGYESDLVISDWWGGGPVQHPGALGLTLLFVSNASMLSLALWTLRVASPRLSSGKPPGDQTASRGA